ncbi:NADH-quinone oxidoreductase subunit L [Dichotomicrobium thermohalophilum]|uniref:Probable inorganic carbon transporter subunit DabB n=1 Tax=Dichotomicrobium thermohalophilum TaxID=933063 RepID=A0A397Q4V5_9HYPH|nr:NADH-quinone oxidoreductase subunit L [Dichotomicrobium thermohalophilum]RIA56132.1 NAD(P)H-quinone oxidoreductase subunit 5 [Dichotomicrobium thermohalophilum]
MELFAVAVVAAPLALLAVWVYAQSAPGMRPRGLLDFARVATLAALAIAVVAGVSVALYGPLTTPTIGSEGLGLSLRLDAVSAVMFLLVAFVGAIVVEYSRNYMDGDARQGVFTGRLCLTLASVVLLVLSGNLVMLVLAWIGTSLALQTLLLFYAERPKAVIAGRKKFITARMSDALLIGAAMLLYQAFGTADIGAILSAATQAEASTTIAVAALLLVGAALLKSAQFPFHGWLPEVMETPTPVSALLHAGIINAGGFLIVRFADVMLLSAASLHLLAIIGGFTALFGAVVMLTQTSIKVSLAWSTVAQMGFMMLQCGLGAFALAVLHIVAHSLYKAHAFLSSGSVIDIARTSWVPEKTPPRVSHVLLALALALVLYTGIGAGFGLAGDVAPQILALGAILIMGLTLFIAQSAAGKLNAYVIGRTLAAATTVTIAYFVLQGGAQMLLADTLPPPPAPGPFAYAIMALAVASFAAVTVLQIIEPSRAATPFWRAARVHIANGLYVNSLFDRFVGAFDRPAAHKQGGAQ